MSYRLFTPNGCTWCERSFALQQEAESAWRAEGKGEEWIGEALADWSADTWREHTGGAHDED